MSERILLLTQLQVAEFTAIMLETAIRHRGDEITLGDIKDFMACAVVLRQELNPMDVLSISLLKNIAERFGLEAKAKDVLEASKKAQEILREIFGEDQGKADTSVSGDERAHSE